MDYPDDAKPWMRFIDDEDVPGLTQWLDAGGNPQAEDRVTGVNAIEHAAVTGRRDIVALLLLRGARPRKAALYAEQAGLADIVYLIRHGGQKKT